jgi:hypothetical protein
MLLDLYNKSGFGQSVKPSIFADKEKDTVAIPNPSFSILGESTPERFYGALNEEMISEGLLPRFMLIEYSGHRPAFNKNHLSVTPSFQLIDQLAALTANSEMIMHAKRVVNIELTPQAQALADDFDRFADNQINGTNKEILRQLWNRAHMKVLKLAGLIAVGVNMNDPIVLPDYIMWAINMVQSDIRALATKFETGEIGTHSSENKQITEMQRIIKDYLLKPWEEISRYCKERNLYNDRVIPYAYISRRCMSLAAYRADRMGATNAVKRTIQTLVESDKFRECGKKELADKYGTTQKCFVLSDLSFID